MKCMHEIIGDTYRFDRKTKQKIYDKIGESIWVIAECGVSALEQVDFADNCFTSGVKNELNGDWNDTNYS